MKKIIIIISALLISIPAAAQLKPYYISIHTGYEKSKQNSNEGNHFSADMFIISPKIGLTLNEKFRFDISYDYKQDNNADTAFDYRNSLGIPEKGLKVKQQNLLLNAFYYPFSDLKINPFVGIGAGWGKVKVSLSDFSMSDNCFAYAAYLGADYKIAANIHIEAVLRYSGMLDPLSSSDLPGSGIKFKDINNFGGTIGVRYTF